jgi:hypothetical protein
VRRQIVQHHPNTLRFRKGNVGEPTHAGGEVHCGTTVGDFDLAPRLMHIEEDEQVGGPIAPVLAVVALELARLGWRTSPMSWVGLSSKQTTGCFGSGFSA